MMSSLKIPGRKAYKAIFFAILCGTTVLLCDGQSAGKLHEPSTEEAKILRAAGISAEFNFPEGRNLHAGLVLSGEKQLNVESVRDDAGADPADLTPRARIAQAACPASVVALGLVTGQTSALSSSETNVITLFNFSVQTVLGSGKNQDLTGKKISVLRQGGVVNAPEGVIRQLDLNSPLLRVGTQYVLFLREMPENGGYISTTGLDFAVTAGSGRMEAVKGHGREELSFESLSKFADVLHDVQLGCGAQR